MKKKITFVSGNFNILHPGHLRLLKFAKNITGYLIVAVNGNSIAGSAASLDEKFRLENIKSCSYVDKVVLIKKSLKEVLTKYKPSFVVKGKEYEDHYNEELEIIKKFNGKLLFSSGDVTFTSKDLIEKEIEINKKFSFPKNYISNHNIQFKNLKAIISKFNKLNIAIIGDLIIDHYVYCQPIGMSQEDNSIVVKENDEKTFVGGAGIVALHAAGMNVKTDFFSVAGDDDELKFAKKLNNKKLIYLFLLINKETLLLKKGSNMMIKQCLDPPNYIKILYLKIWREG